MNKDISIAIIAIVIIFGLTFGLGTMRADLPLTASRPYAEKTGKETKTGKIVMRVNDEPVTEGEFKAYAETAPAEQRGFLVTTPEGRRMLANEIVKVKALEHEASRLGVADDPNVKVQIDLASSQILAGRALEKMVKDKVEAYVREEYEKEKGNTLALRHIVIAYQGGQLPPRGGQTPTLDQAKQRAAEIAKRLRAGEDFSSVARAESDDQQSAVNGGSLGATRREMLPPEIAALVGKLKFGQISDPVQTQYGVHVFRVDQPTLEDLRPALQRSAQQKAVEETVAQLQKAAKVDLDPEFFPQPTQPMQRPTAKTNG